MDATVRPDGDRWTLVLADGQRFTCVIGRGGIVPAADKREGDGATPLGCWPLRRVLYRPDRRPAPATALPSRALDPTAGWCDDPDHPAYNTEVRRPFPAGHERLWRDDRLYDLVVVLGHNDDPPVAGAGSAIFLHVMHPEGRPTAGCVALAPADLDTVLAALGPGDRLCIRDAPAGGAASG